MFELESLKEKILDGHMDLETSLSCYQPPVDIPAEFRIEHMYFPATFERAAMLTIRAQLVQDLLREEIDNARGQIL